MDLTYLSLIIIVLLIIAIIIGILGGFFAINEIIVYFIRRFNKI